MKKPSGKQGKRSAEVAEKTRAEIIASATELFSVNGYDTTTLREIAAHSGIAHGTIRHHFGSKFEIWKAVADQVMLHYQIQLLPIVSQAAQSDDHLKSFQRVVRGFIKVSIEHPDFARLLVREGTTNNERSAYFQQHFVHIHLAIELLFDKARSESPHLKRYNNDSFFLALLSLTFFPLLMPNLAQSLPSVKDSDRFNREQFIFGVLFPD